MKQRSHIPDKADSGYLSTMSARYPDRRNCSDQGSLSDFRICRPKRACCFAYCNEQIDRLIPVYTAAVIIIH